jgi:hypothetical protein
MLHPISIILTMPLPISIIPTMLHSFSNIPSVLHTRRYLIFLLPEEQKWQSLRTFQKVMLLRQSENIW